MVEEISRTLCIVVFVKVRDPRSIKDANVVSPRSCYRRNVHVRVSSFFFPVVNELLDSKDVSWVNEWKCTVCELTNIPAEAPDCSRCGMNQKKIWKFGYCADCPKVFRLTTLRESFTCLVCKVPLDAVSWECIQKDMEENPFTSCPKEIKSSGSGNDMSQGSSLSVSLPNYFGTPLVSLFEPTSELKELKRKEKKIKVEDDTTSGEKKKIKYNEPSSFFCHKCWLYNSVRPLHQSQTFDEISWTQCVFCHAERQPESWECALCTFVNVGKDAQCVMCGEKVSQTSIGHYVSVMALHPIEELYVTKMCQYLFKMNQGSYFFNVKYYLETVLLCQMERRVQQFTLLLAFYPDLPTLEYLVENRWSREDRFFILTTLAENHLLDVIMLWSFFPNILPLRENPFFFWNKIFTVFVQFYECSAFILFATTETLQFDKEIISLVVNYLVSNNDNILQMDAILQACFA